MDEQALIEATLRGELRAFEQLARRYQTALVTSACHLIRRADDAEDLAQEALVEAFKRLHTLREPAKFGGWLFAILRGKCLNYLRRRRPELSLEECGDVFTAPDSPDDGEVAELMNRLPLRDREALAARYLYGLEYHEIASALGLSVSAAKMRCLRARDRLRHLLQQADEERTRLLLQRAMGVLLVGGISAAFMDRVLGEVNAMHTAAALPASHAISGHALWTKVATPLIGWKGAAGLVVALGVAGIGLVLSTQKPPAPPRTPWIAAAAMAGTGGDHTVDAKPVLPAIVGEAMAQPVPRTAPADVPSPQAPGNHAAGQQPPAAPPTAPARAITFTGTVVRTDGQPAADALVAISTPGIDDPRVMRTDRQGVFSVDIDAEIAEGGKPITAAIYTPGHALTVATLQPGKNAITLWQPRTAHGTVLDEAGEPVAGAIVRVQTIAADPDFTPQPGWYYIFREPFASLFTTKTDADGNWRIADLARGSRTTILLDDPRYVTWFTQRRIPQMPGYSTRFHTDPIIAAPGASITGNVFDAAGKPAVGYFVNCGFSGKEILTAEDGSYRVDSLNAYTYSVTVSDPAKRWTFGSLDRQQVTAGQVTAAPDIILPGGGTIEGTVSNAATRTLMKYVYLRCVRVGEETGYDASTDTDGRFRLPVNPGAYMLSGPSFSNGQPQAEPVTVEVKPGETKTVAIARNPGLTLTGKAVDQQGNPAAGASLKLRLFCGQCGTKGCEKDYTRSFAAGGDGGFTVSGLAPGRFRIEYDTDNPNRKWKLAALVEEELPLRAPLRVVMEPQQVTTHTITGRVVTPDGQPVADADVAIDLLYRIDEHSYGVPFVITTTDADGRYTAIELPAGKTPEVRSVIVQKPGYLQVNTGLPKLDMDRWTISDQVMRRCSATVAGTIRTPDGAPAPGITIICADTGAEHRVVTGADGKFTLSQLPEGEVHLVATGTGIAGWWQGMAGNTVEITVLPVLTAKPGDKELAWQLAQQMPLAMLDGCLPVLAAVDYDRAMTLAADAGEPVSDSLRAKCLCALAGTDPARTAAMGMDQLNGITNPELRMETALAVGLAVARQYPDIGKECYLQAQGLIDPGRKIIKVRHFGEMIQLAGLLSREEAEAVLEQARAFYQAHYPAAYPWYCVQLAEMVAAVSPQLAEKVWSDATEEERSQAMDRAVAVIAGYDLAEAQRLQAREKALYPNSYPSRSLTAICAALAKTDPEAALALAGTRGNVDALLKVAPYLPKERALQVYRESFTRVTKQEVEPFVNQVRLVARINALDPAAAAPLFRATRRMLKQFLEEDTTQDPSIAKRTYPVRYYAFYCGTLDPLETRLLLETELARGDRYAPSYYALAMAPLDLNRAFAITNDIADRQTREQVIAGLFRYLLASENERLIGDWL